VIDERKDEDQAAAGKQTRRNAPEDSETEKIAK
jgi:hypothetical protein